MRRDDQVGSCQVRLDCSNPQGRPPGRYINCISKSPSGGRKEGEFIY